MPGCSWDCLAQSDMGCPAVNCDRLGRLKHTVRVCWEHLAEPLVRRFWNSHLQDSFNQMLREVGDTEPELTMFHVSIVDVGFRNCGRRILVPVLGVAANGHCKAEEGVISGVVGLWDA